MELHSRSSRHRKSKVQAVRHFEDSHILPEQYLCIKHVCLTGSRALTRSFSRILPPTRDPEGAREISFQPPRIEHGPAKVSWKKTVTMDNSLDAYIDQQGARYLKSSQN